MHRPTRRVRWRSVASAWIVIWLLPCFSSPAPGGERPAASYLPADAPFFAVLRDGDQQVRAFRALLADLAFEESAAYRNLDSNPKLTQARIGAYGIAAMVASDPWTAAGVLLGREVAVAVTPGGGRGPRVAIVAAPRDAPAFDRMLGALHRMAGLERDGQPDDARSGLVDGVRVYNAAADFFHCRIDDALVLANDRELLQTIIAGRDAPDANLAATAAYRAARDTAPADAAIWACADMAAVRRLLGPDRPLPEKFENPLAGFIAGGWWHAIRNADSVVAWVTPAERTLKIDLRVTCGAFPPETHRGFAPSRPTGFHWPAAGLPRFVGEIAVTRDWAGLFSEREALLSLTAAGQAVQFSNGVTTLLGQLDFSDDILPIISGPARLIVAGQRFDALPYTPTPRLPAFALVVPLRFPEESGFARRLFAATQTAVSALSLIAKQEGNPPYLMDTDRHRGYRIVFSEYDDPAEMDAMRRQMAGEGDASAPDSPRANGPPAEAATAARRLAGVRYNFAPAAALVEDQYVVATSSALLRDIIDAIVAAKASDSPPAGREAPPDALELRGPAIVQLLRDNYDELVANAMLEKDQPRAQAEDELNLLLGLLEFGARLGVSATQPERGLAATFELALTRPASSMPVRNGQRP